MVYWTLIVMKLKYKYVQWVHTHDKFSYSINEWFDANTMLESLLLVRNMP